MGFAVENLSRVAWGYGIQMLFKDPNGLREIDLDRVRKWCGCGCGPKGFGREQDPVFISRSWREHKFCVTEMMCLNLNGVMEVQSCGFTGEVVDALQRRRILHIYAAGEHQRVHLDKMQGTSISSMCRK